MNKFEEWLNQPVPGFKRRRDSLSIAAIRAYRIVWADCIELHKFPVDKPVD